MANARAASLLNQRNPYGKVRVLAPVNTTISSIAKQSASSEVQAMVDKYNAGEIGNSEMLDFLNRQLVNPYLSAAQKTDVQDQIRNFSSLVQKDALESAYKLAPDNSLQKIQAAQALSQFYATRAAGMAPGTPAQSTALSNKAQWDNAVQTVTQSMQQEQIKNMQYQAEAQINTLPSNSSDRATQKAEMWKQLYDQAIQNGDQTSAAKYAANYNQEITVAQELQTREQTTQEKTTIRNYFGALQNAYHDGQINEQQYLQGLADISARVDATGDYGLINTLNRTTDQIQKALDKGGHNIGTTASGLPVVLKGYKGGGGGVQTDYDKNAYDYSENLRLAQEMIHAGKDASGNPYTSEMYQEDVIHSITDYAQVLDKEISVMETVAESNPNQKVYFEGKKQRVADVVDQLYKAADEIRPQAEAIQGGNFAIMEVSPKESSTNPNGKPVATYTIVDKNNLDPNTITSDASGIIHEILKESAPLSLDQQAQVFNGVYIDPTTSKSYKAFQDASGNWNIYTGGQYVNIYEPGGTNKYTTTLTGEKNQYIPSFGENKVGMELTPNQTHVEGTQAQAQLEKAKKIQSQQQNLTAPGTLPVQPQVTKPITETPGLKVEKPIPVPVGTPTPKPVGPITVTQEPQATITPNMPGLSIPKQNTIMPGLTSSTPVSQPISIAPAKPLTLQTNTQGQISQPGLTVNYVPPKTPVPAKVPAPSLGTILGGAIGQGINKIKSLFKF